MTGNSFRGFAEGLSQVIWHNFIKFTLCYITELQMFNLDAFPCVSDMVDVRLHFVQVALESLFVFLIREFNIFEAFRQFRLLLLLTPRKPVMFVTF